MNPPPALFSYQGINLPFVCFPNPYQYLQILLHQHGCHPKIACFSDGYAIVENNSVIFYTNLKQGCTQEKLHRNPQKRLAVGVAGRCEPQGGALATPLLSPACHPIVRLEPDLCNTNRRLLLFLSAVIVKLSSVKGVYRLLYRQNFVY